MDYNRFTIIFYLLVVVTGQTLFYEAFTDNIFTTVEEWTIMGSTGIYSDCGSSRILGGYGVLAVDGRIMKLFDLPPHHSIQITFEFFKMDSWDNEFFYFYADAHLLFSAQYLYGSTDVNLCGMPDFTDSVTYVDQSLTHGFSSLIVFFTSNLNEQPLTESWGIRNFKLYLFLCPPGCFTCTSTDTRDTCFSWILFESNLFFYATASDGWLIDNGFKEITQCGSISLLGGFDKTGQNSRIMKQIQLPTHTSLKIKFRFVLIDAWDNKNAFLFIDGIQQWSLTYDYTSRKLENVCGDQYDEIFSNQEITLIHSNSQIKIEFSTNLNQGYNVQSFGIRDFELFTICSDGDPLFCGNQCGNGITEGIEQCDDGNIYPFDGCFNCQYSCTEGCSNCINGICIECKKGWEFVQDLNLCIPEKNDQIIAFNESCDDILHKGICMNGEFILQDNCEQNEFGHCKLCEIGFLLIDNVCESVCQDLTMPNSIECNNSTDECHQCQNSIIIGWQEVSMNQCLYCMPGWNLNVISQMCEPICGDEIINGLEQCDSNQLTEDCYQCKFQCQDACINCQYGKCTECQQGWIVNNGKCLAICGDGLVVGDQACDDQNQARFDGCYECQNNCQVECQTCFEGKCINCFDGWKLNNEGICESICGDGQIQLFSLEECDGNEGLYGYGCNECKLQCCPECQQCNLGLCQQCNPTFTLINNQCLPICGDGQISVDYEDCDDINDNDCINCQYQCLETCQNCKQGKCLDTCPSGYNLVNEVCESICGDQIIAGLEQCDDGNNINFDGCYECEFACPTNCNSCQDGQCIDCLQGFILQDSNACTSLCGDGQIAIGVEYCDDENTNNLDGCQYQCEIETNYLCNNNTLSECTYVQHPKLKLKLIKQNYQYQYVQIYFTQAVKTKLQTSFFNSLQLSLNIDTQYYQIQLQIIQDASDQISDVEYQAIIFINQVLTIKPIFQVELLDTLYNELDAPLINLNEEINLEIPKILSEAQKEAAKKLGKISSNLVESVGGLGVILMFLGNSFVLWEQLEILQQQSYLKFVNVEYPENLFIYFESSNLVSMQPIQNFIQFDEKTNFIETPFEESYEKFKFYQVNANIFANLKTQGLVLLMSIISYYAFLVLQKCLNKLQLHHYAFLGLFLSKLILKLQNFVNHFVNEFKQKGINQLFIANIWDLFFISFLQIRSIQFISYYFYLKFFVAMFIVILLMMLASTSMNRSTLLHFTFKLYWVKQHNFFLILKKLIFIFILVCFQLNQIIQTLLLSIISALYIAYIIVVKPAENKIENVKLIIMEVTVLIFLLTEFIYWDQLKISYEKQVQGGFFHIGILASTLLVSLMFQIIGVLQKIRQFVKQKEIKLQSVQEKSPNPFPLSRVIQNIK